MGWYLVKRRVIRKDHTFKDVKFTLQDTPQAGSTKRLLGKRDFWTSSRDNSG